MNFDRQGYQKTIYATTFLDKWMTSVLLYMSVHCENDMTVKRSQCEATKICAALRCSEPMARDAVNRLMKHKLITRFKKKRVLHYQLPTERRLSTYLPPDDEKAARNKSSRTGEAH